MSPWMRFEHVDRRPPSDEQPWATRGIGLSRGESDEHQGRSAIDSLLPLLHTLLLRWVRPPRPRMLPLPWACRAHARERDNVAATVLRARWALTLTSAAAQTSARQHAIASARARPRKTLRRQIVFHALAASTAASVAAAASSADKRTLMTSAERANMKRARRQNMRSRKLGALTQHSHVHGQFDACLHCSRWLQGDTACFKRG